MAGVSRGMGVSRQNASRHGRRRPGESHGHIDVHARLSKSPAASPHRLPRRNDVIHDAHAGARACGTTKHVPLRLDEGDAAVHPSSAAPTPTDLHGTPHASIKGDRGNDDRIDPRIAEPLADGPGQPLHMPPSPPANRRQRRRNRNQRHRRMPRFHQGTSIADDPSREPVPHGTSEFPDAFLIAMVLPRQNRLARLSVVIGAAQADPADDPRQGANEIHGEKPGAGPA